MAAYEPAAATLSATPSDGGYRSGTSTSSWPLPAQRAERRVAFGGLLGPFASGAETFAAATVGLGAGEGLR